MLPARILLTAPSSGSGKTLVTCGLLQAMKNRGKKVISFKCGPDYIDPMFHSMILGTKSRNLDTFFADRDTVRYLFEKNSSGYELAVLEGVMGYYDGLGGISTRSSAYEVAQVTDTPVILCVDGKGSSVSLVALVKGFLEYKEDSRIRGVILNRVSGMLYPRLKEMIESQLPVRVVGYVPYVPDCVLESRHLGLVTPDEIKDLKERVEKLAKILETSIEWDVLEEIAGSNRTISEQDMQENVLIRKVTGQDKDSTVVCTESGKQTIYHRETGSSDSRISIDLSAECSDNSNHLANERKPSVTIGVARDEAFCFFYEDNLQLLQELGAKLLYFSPLHDKKLPEYVDGLMFHGGYPELYAEALSKNTEMLDSVREALQNGVPCMAECGGFMYLHEQMEDMNHRPWTMAGIIPGYVKKTERLGRFGYITLEGGKVFGKDVGTFPAHEFHYFDSDCCGEDFLAKKPVGNRSWHCIHSTDTLFAGFPHLYFYGNPGIAQAFVGACIKYKFKL